jgi:hypothetical protein
MTSTDKHKVADTITVTAKVNLLLISFVVFIDNPSDFHVVCRTQPAC